jgi:hypothetical protein
MPCFSCSSSTTHPDPCLSIGEQPPRGGCSLTGLNYIDSWVVDDGNLNRCFQLMETDDPSLFEIWLERWADLGTAEVFSVLSSEEASRRAGVALDGPHNP